MHKIKFAFRILIIGFRISLSDPFPDIPAILNGKIFTHEPQSDNTSARPDRRTAPAHVPSWYWHPPPGNFTPYFQYRIGKSQNDWHLYFRREPFARRYYNECFNRIAALSGSDIYRFIGFHYERYPDKTDFTRFLHYEITDRLRQKLPRAYRDKLLTALHWVTEAEGANQAQPVVTAPSNSLQERMEALFQQAEEKLHLAAGRLPTGSIELNNRSHEDKLIQCLILLKEVTAPAHVAKSEQLFKRISDIDIATILHLHIEHSGTKNSDHPENHQATKQTNQAQPSQSPQTHRGATGVFYE